MFWQVFDSKDFPGIAVQVLSSLGQSSMLHVRGERVSHERVSRALQALQVPPRLYTFQRLSLPYHSSQPAVPVSCMSV